MQRPNEDIHKLWALPPDDFNAWRRRNDLPTLLSFFKETLPHFAEWQLNHGVDDDVFLGVTRQSRFFLGSRIAYVWSDTGLDWEVGNDVTRINFSDRPIDVKEFAQRQLKDFGRIRYSFNWQLSFVPYFHWLRVVKGLKEFRVAGSDPNAFRTDFAYGRTDAYQTIYSRTFLFAIHRVLKLGGVTIPAFSLDRRNLDFVDLDHLAVTGQGESWETHIAYASCRSLLFKNYNKPFVTFEKCDIESPRFENCHLERFVFIECGLSRPVFRNARLARCVLNRSGMGEATFIQCDLVDLKVIPPRRASPDFYKRLRSAFQSQGSRDEAARFYYYERWQELKDRALPLMPRIEGLPGFYAPSTLYQSWRRGQMDAAKVVHLVGTNMVTAGRVLRSPRMIAVIAREKFRLAADVIDWLVWGFGERPGRVFVWMAAVIAVFAVRYYRGPTAALHGNWAQAMSCSLYNFATIGCEWRGRFDSVEGICGAILLAIMVAGFSNRTRY